MDNRLPRLYISLYEKFCSLNSHEVRAISKKIAMTESVKVCYSNEERELISRMLPTDNLTTIQIPVCLYRAREKAFSSLYTPKQIGSATRNYVQLELRSSAKIVEAKQLFGEIIHSLISADVATAPPVFDPQVAPRQKGESKPREQIKFRTKTSVPFTFENKRIEGTHITKIKNGIAVQIGHAPISASEESVPKEIKVPRLKWADRIMEVHKNARTDLSPLMSAVVYANAILAEQSINEDLRLIEKYIVPFYGFNYGKANTFVKTLHAELERAFVQTENSALKWSKSDNAASAASTFYKEIEFIWSNAVDCMTTEFDIEGVAQNLGVTFSLERKREMMRDAEIKCHVMTMKDHVAVQFTATVLELIRKIPNVSSRKKRDLAYQNMAGVLEENKKRLIALGKDKVKQDCDFKVLIGLRSKDQADYNVRFYARVVELLDDIGLYTLKSLAAEIKHAVYIEFGEKSGIYEDVSEALKSFDEIRSDSFLPIGGPLSFIYKTLKWSSRLLLLAAASSDLIYFADHTTVHDRAPLNTSEMRQFTAAVQEVFTSEYNNRRQENMNRAFGLAAVLPAAYTTYQGIKSAVGYSTNPLATVAIDSLLYTGSYFLANNALEYKNPSNVKAFRTVNARIEDDLSEIAKLNYVYPEFRQDTRSLFRIAAFAHELRNDIDPLLQEFNSRNVTAYPRGLGLWQTKMTLSNDMFQTFNYIYQREVNSVIGRGTANPMISDIEYDVIRNKLGVNLRNDINRYFDLDLLLNTDDDETKEMIDTLVENTLDTAMAVFEPTNLGNPLNWVDYLKNSQGIQLSYIRLKNSGHEINMATAVPATDHFNTLSTDERLAILTGQSFYDPLGRDLSNTLKTLPITPEIVKPLLHYATKGDEIASETLAFGAASIHGYNFARKDPTGFRFFDTGRVFFDTAFTVIPKSFATIPSVTSSIMNVNQIHELIAAERFIDIIAPSEEKEEPYSSGSIPDKKIEDMTTGERIFQVINSIMPTVDFIHSWDSLIHNPVGHVMHGLSVMWIGSAFKLFAAVMAIVGTKFINDMRTSEDIRYPEEFIIPESELKIDLESIKKNSEKQKKAAPSLMITAWTSLNKAFIKDMTSQERAYFESEITELLEIAWGGTNILVYGMFPLLFGSSYVAGVLFHHLTAIAVPGVMSGIAGYFMGANKTDKINFKKGMTIMALTSVGNLAIDRNIIQCISMIAAMFVNMTYLEPKRKKKGGVTFGLEEKSTAMSIRRLALLASHKEFALDVLGRDNIFVHGEFMFFSSTLQTLSLKFLRGELNVRNIMEKAESAWSSLTKYPRYEDLFDPASGEITNKAYADLQRMIMMQLISGAYFYMRGGNFGYKILGALTMSPSDPIEIFHLKQHLESLSGYPSRELQAFIEFLWEAPQTE